MVGHTLGDASIPLALKVVNHITFFDPHTKDIFNIQLLPWERLPPLSGNQSKTR
jgi:hypothetical protein